MCRSRRLSVRIKRPLIEWGALYLGLRTSYRRSTIAGSFARHRRLVPVPGGRIEISRTRLLGSESVTRETDRLLPRGAATPTPAPPITTPLRGAAVRPLGTITMSAAVADRGKRPRFVSMTAVFD